MEDPSGCGVSVERNSKLSHTKSCLYWSWDQELMSTTQPGSVLEVSARVSGGSESRDSDGWRLSHMQSYMRLEIRQVLLGINIRRV